MLVYLVRHGETVGNKEGFHQVPETPLTEHGIEQAKKVAKRLKTKSIDLIYSSTHDRAMNTSRIIAEELGLTIEPWGELVETRRPKEILGKSGLDPEEVKIQNLIKENFGKKDWRFSDEENYDDITQRAKRVLDHLLSQHKDQTVLCISHGTFIKAIVLTMLFGDKLTPEIYQVQHHFYTRNTGITLAEYTKEYGWGLITWNDIDHL